MSTNNETSYRTMNDRDWYKARPGNMINGGIGNIREKGFIYDDKTSKVIYKEYEYNNCLYNLIREAIENVNDEAKSLVSKYPNDTTRQCTKIKVDIELEDDGKLGLTKVYNNGIGMPIKKTKIRIGDLQSSALNNDMSKDELNKTKEYYNIHANFAFPRTGSNFGKRDKVIGQNGLGTKAICMCSSIVQVRNYNIDQNKLYTQIYKDQLNIIEDPIIKDFGTTKKHDKGFTSISWLPNFEYIKDTNCYTNDDIAKITLLIIDFSFNIGRPIIFNDVTYDYSSYEKYAALYLDLEKYRCIHVTTKDSDVYLYGVNNQTKFTSVAFINGVRNERGSHITDWKKAMIKPIINNIKKSSKDYEKITLTISTIQKYFFMFIFCTQSNVIYNGQNKTGTANIKVKTTQLSAANLRIIKKWDVYNDILNNCRSKIIGKNKLKTAKKKARIDVHKLVDASEAGKKDSNKCTLFITEGDSAAGTAAYIRPLLLNGNGTKYYGYMPVKGKILNVRNSTLGKITDNEEIRNINDALGLTIYKDYSKPENFATLRYGHVVCMTDSDHDGSHIRCLLYNIFEYLYPGLIQNKDFFGFLRTISVKIVKTGQEFYSEEAFKKWCIDNPNVKFKQGDVKYFKGLGTLTNRDKDRLVKKFNIVYINAESDISETLHKSFDDSQADYRKYQISNYKFKNIYKEDVGIQYVDGKTMIDMDLAGFGVDSVQSKLPNLIDGLKECHRKILYTWFKKYGNTKKDIKVGTLGPFTSGYTYYHHGEKSLNDAIIAMARDYPGSNNIPYISKQGEFGSREFGGANAASDRYTYVNKEPYTQLLFNIDNIKMLHYKKNEDGNPIEPEYFQPVICLALVNGSLAFPYGWKTDIPQFNYKDIINHHKQYIQCYKNGEGGVIHKKYIPYYRGFTGEIVPYENGFITRGKYKLLSKKNGTYTYKISEYPIGVSYETQLTMMKYGITAKKDVKKIATKLIKPDKDKQTITYFEKKTKKYTGKNGNDKNDITYIVESNRELSLKDLRLEHKIPMVNLVLLTPIKNEDGTITNVPMAYDNIDDILDTFCFFKIDYYIELKKFKLLAIADKTLLLHNKIRYVRKFRKDPDYFIKSTTIKETEDKLETDKFDRLGDDKSYKYLHNITTGMLNRENFLTNLKIKFNAFKKEYFKLKDIESLDLWLADINEVEKILDKYVPKLPEV